MAKWQIEPREYLRRLGLKIEEFEERLHLPKVEDITQIIPLRDIHEIQSIVPISVDTLEYLLRQVKTLDGRFVFEKARVRMKKVDPCDLKIGQKFVYREKYASLVENVPNIFSRFLTGSTGLGNLGAYFVFGLNGNGGYSMACYLPPLIEQHGPDFLITDGVNRTYLAMQVGIAINSLQIENINLPFPCLSKEWSEVRLISLSERPVEMAGRYFQFQQGFFRDLKYLGIDG